MEVLSTRSLIVDQNKLFHHESPIFFEKSFLTLQTYRAIGQESLPFHELNLHTKPVQAIEDHEIKYFQEMDDLLLTHRAR